MAKLFDIGELVKDPEITPLVEEYFKKVKGAFLPYFGFPAMTKEEFIALLKSCLKEGKPIDEFIDLTPPPGVVY